MKQALTIERMTEQDQHSPKQSNENRFVFATSSEDGSTTKATRTIFSRMFSTNWWRRTV